MKSNNEKTTNDTMNCKFFNSCGGCSMLDKSYEEHLAIKQKLVNGLLENICEVREIVPSPALYHYRNKVHAAFSFAHGRISYGTYAQGTHKIITHEDCLLENTEASAIISDVAKLAKSFRVPIYNEKDGTGLLRRVLVRIGNDFVDNHSDISDDSTVLVVLVLSASEFPGKKAFIKELIKLHPKIRSVVINVNSRRDSMILGDRSYTAFGGGYIKSKILGVNFKISPESFFQINRLQTENLYSIAMEAAALDRTSTVIDAYCGIGTIGIIAAKSGVASVTGIELNPKAVIDARENALQAGLKNISFIASDAGIYMTKLASSNKRCDVLFMDPPRAGTDKFFIEACKTLAPTRIVYISCDPKTLARDLLLFEKEGYIANYAIPVDMFPWTSHVETVVLLVRKKAG